MFSHANYLTSASISLKCLCHKDYRRKYEENFCIITTSAGSGSPAGGGGVGASSHLPTYPPGNGRHGDAQVEECGAENRAREQGQQNASGKRWSFKTGYFQNSQRNILDGGKSVSKSAE